jgi:hypothetical protein
MCAFVQLLGCCVVAEARYNWYLFYINIFLLSKRKKSHSLKLTGLAQLKNLIPSRAHSSCSLGVSIWCASLRGSKQNIKPRSISTETSDEKDEVL